MKASLPPGRSFIPVAISPVSTLHQAQLVCFSSPRAVCTPALVPHHLLPSPETEVPARALQLQMFILHKNSTKWEAVLHPKLWEKGRLAGRERVKEKRGNIQCHPAQ